jgi:hypothetical protein
MLIDGQIAVNSADLQTFIFKVLGQNLSVKAIASMLTAIGARNLRIRTPHGSHQGRWLLPVVEFNPGDYIKHSKGDKNEIHNHDRIN